MRDALPSHAVSSASSAERNRPVEYAGILLGSAAAALIFGAGVSHAEGTDNTSPSHGGDKSASGQQAGGGTQTGGGNQAGAGNQAGPKKESTGTSKNTGAKTTGSQSTKSTSDDEKSENESDDNKSEDKKSEDTKTENTKTDDKKFETTTVNPKSETSKDAPSQPKNDTPKTSAPTLKVVSTPTPAQLATPTQLVSSSPSPSSLPSPSATLLTTAITTAASTPQATPKIAALAPTTSVTAGPPVPDFPAIARQLQGLGNDVAALGASLTYNTAIQVANAFGPNFLFGGPYYTALTVANIAGTISKQLTGTPLTATSAGPFPVNYGIFDTNAFLNPNVVPAGANDPNITVTAQHPLPVILINGTLESQGYNWSVGAPVLANAGYKVYTFNYGMQPGLPVNGLGDIKASAQQLSDEIDAVLKETKAKQVILVGHSQGGGILPEYYLNVMGGAPKVAQLIGISPSNHGTDLNFIAYGLGIPVIGQLIRTGLGATFPALEQQSINSSLIQEVYGNGDTQSGVRYTTIVSKYDGVVTPYTQQFLTGPDVTNILVQDQYPNIMAGHLGLFVNPVTWGYVLDALSANPAANVNPLTTPLALAV